ncbi:SAM-dependent methyltransferase [Pseudorhodoplanes sinuspersici]|uniref:SAM-dependent methyltransferase n=1 Tax=Pseudorhodoplanes sinuspersici TaxID=1235591 RepID=A0A1W6ZTP9_9HYPH|nr:cyclopropane-fatty-acyl-phospholipid synthase family protein [Pseudorhodoplanes sinuspersici]ARQ00135.1 SAM-dependent methyltransferase [Pseudorhodoplanes sinuspersici]RKE65654.1 cyclopropane-fatty-acyl-phospholipid synthase [Pseudorhodoplanes sinuspersici]
MLFPAVLKSIVRTGSLRLIDGAGRINEYGNGTPPYCTVRLSARHLDYTLALNPELSIGEAYMDGLLTVEEGTLFDLLEIAARNYSNFEQVAWFSLLSRTTRRLKQHNPIGRARHNVAHHYDLSDQLYDLFLDKDRQYSCAYFTSKDDNLDTAQENKKRHIAAKLLLERPRLKILDLGSGWGGLGLYLAEETGADVTGVTLSVKQHQVAEARAAAAGLADRLRFHLRDYREESGQYDRVVSVGMFEHVGKKNYDEFFAKLGELLATDGVALLHSIGYADAPAPINPFIRKYIFPGADLPSLSEVFAAADRSGLIVTDVEILRLHYAETLRHWRERFIANWPRVAALYDERFCRMWEFYLVLCEIGFRFRSMMVFQMQLAKRADTIPLTRDYMVNWERANAPTAHRRIRTVE